MFQEWLKDYEKLREENNMSEEEILNYLEKVSKEKTIMPLDEYIQGLLDLYTKEKLNSLSLSEQLNKEKEKNKKIEDKIKGKIRIRKEEKSECKDSIEADKILREIYVLEELLGE